MRVYKRWVVAGVTAIPICAVIELLGLGGTASNFVSGLPGIGPFFADIPQAVQDFLFEDYPGVSSFLPVAFILFGLYSHPKILGGFLSRIWPDPPAWLDTVLDKDGQEEGSAYKPGQSFVGREEEMAWLNKFGGTESTGYKWSVLHGGMGRGKTRTALEWLRGLQASKKPKWDAGVFLDMPGAELAGIRLRRPTAVMIDEAGDRDDLWPKLVVLIRQAIESKQPLRILLTDQVDLDQPRLELQKDTDLLNQRRDDFYKSYRVPRLPEPECDSLGAETQMSPPAIRRAEGRPLLLRLGENPWPRLAYRAQKRLYTIAKSDDERMWLAVAALTGGLPVTELPPEIPHVSVPRRKRLFEGESDLKTRLPKLKPAIFAGEVLLQWLSDHDVRMDELLRQLIASHPGPARRRIEDMLATRPEGPVAIALLAGQDMPVGLERCAETSARNLARLARLRPPDAARFAADDILRLKAKQHDLGESGDTEAMMDMHDSIGRRAATWPQDINVIKAYAVALGCYASHLDGVAQAVELEQALDRLVQFSESYADHPDIAYNYAGAVFNAAASWGRSELPDRWAQVDGHISVLSVLAKTYADHPDIVLQYAKSLIYAVQGMPQTRPERDAAWTELERVSRAYSLDGPIQTLLGQYIPQLTYIELLRKDGEADGGSP